MKPGNDCLSCIRKQAERTLRLGVEEKSEAVLSPQAEQNALLEVDTLLSNPTEYLTPAELALQVQRILCRHTGVEDPFLRYRQDSNQAALKLLPQLGEKIRSSRDPLQTAALIAAAGASFDFACERSEGLEGAIERIERQGFARSDFEKFREELGQVTALLYLADNAGEIVFDRLFLATLKEQYPGVEITVAVNRCPMLNSALRRDALEAGLEACGEILDKGYDGAGTVLAQAGDDFQLAFSTSDIILSKGEANFQTLQQRPDTLYFLLQAGCKTMAEALNVQPGDAVFLRSY